MVPKLLFMQILLLVFQIQSSVADTACCMAEVGICTSVPNYATCCNSSSCCDITQRCSTYCTSHSSECEGVNSDEPLFATDKTLIISKIVGHITASVYDPLEALLSRPPDPELRLYVGTCSSSNLQESISCILTKTVIFPEIKNTVSPTWTGTWRWEHVTDGELSRMDFTMYDIDPNNSRELISSCPYNLLTQKRVFKESNAKTTITIQCSGYSLDIDVVVQVTLTQCNSRTPHSCTNPTKSHSKMCASSADGTDCYLQPNLSSCNVQCPLNYDKKKYIGNGSRECLEKACDDREQGSPTYPCLTANCYAQPGTTGCGSGCPDLLFQKDSTGRCSLKDCPSRRKNSSFPYYPCGEATCYLQPNSEICAVGCPIKLYTPNQLTGTCVFLSCSQRMSEESTFSQYPCGESTCYLQPNSDTCNVDCPSAHYSGGANGRCNLKSSCSDRNVNNSADAHSPCGQGCYQMPDDTCVSDCPQAHFMENPSTGKCVLKNCEVRVENSSSDIAYPCGEASCYLQPENDHKCGGSCPSAHYQPNPSSGVCVPKICTERSPQENSLPCGPLECFLQLDGLSCRQSCPSAHSTSTNEGRCVLKPECGSHLVDQDAHTPCGKGCILELSGTDRMIKSAANNNYLCAQDGTRSPPFSMAWNRTSGLVDRWEGFQFIAVDVDAGKYYLKAVEHHTYVSAKADGTVFCDVDTPGDDEIFTVHRVGLNSFSIQTAFGKYISPQAADYIEEGVEKNDVFCVANSPFVGTLEIVKIEPDVLDKCHQCYQLPAPTDTCGSDTDCPQAHYMENPSTGKCVLKNCQDRVENSSSGVAYPCGEASCLLQPGSEHKCGDSCPSAHYQPDPDFSGVCVLKTCTARNPQGTGLPCGPLECFLQWDGLSCGPNCLPSAHFISTNEGRCILKPECQSRLVDLDADTPCGEGCFLLSNNTCDKENMCVLRGPVTKAQVKAQLKAKAQVKAQVKSMAQAKAEAQAKAKAKAKAQANDGEAEDEAQVQAEAEAEAEAEVEEAAETEVEEVVETEAEEEAEFEADIENESVPPCGTLPCYLQPNSESCDADCPAGFRTSEDGLCVLKTCPEYPESCPENKSQGGPRLKSWVIAVIVVAAVAVAGGVVTGVIVLRWQMLKHGGGSSGAEGSEQKRVCYDSSAPMEEGDPASMSVHTSPPEEGNQMKKVLFDEIDGDDNCAQKELQSEVAQE